MFDGDFGSRDHIDDRRMNVIQLLVMSWVVALVSGYLARVAGFGWGATLLIGWVGGIFGALVLGAIVVLVDAILPRPPRATDLESSEALEALIGAWDEDLTEDREAARARMTDAATGAAGAKRRGEG